jgi:hypothetical protein
MRAMAVDETMAVDEMNFVTKLGPAASRKYRETNLHPHHVPDLLVAV